MRTEGSLAKSFSYALEGIKAAYKEEPNIKIHLTIAGLVLVSAILLGFTLVEWLILILTISIVIIVELINTSIEDAINLLHPEIHPLAKRAKDVMAAAVLASAICASVVGLLLFLPKLFNLF